ncbi:MAG: hypothetical protein ACRDZ2_02800 [Ilumatobacteraceae bacterium]
MNAEGDAPPADRADHGLIGTAGTGVVVDDRADPGPPPTPPRRRLNRELLLISLALAIGLVLIGLGVLRSVTGDEVTDLPDAIEEIAPTPDAEQVLQQTDVFVDLAEGYEGELTVDGVALETIRLDQLAPLDAEPGQQVEVPPGAIFEPGNGTLRFRPGEGTGIDSFEPGTHNVVVTFWRTAEGRDAARSYGWTFVVI